MRQACTSTTWLWNLHADAHDFRSHTSDLENISRRVFASHFGHLSLIFIWLSWLGQFGVDGSPRTRVVPDQ